MTPEERRAYQRAYYQSDKGRKCKQRSYIKHQRKWREYAATAYRRKKDTNESTDE